MQKREGLWVLHIVVLCSNSTGVINLTYVKVKSLLLVLHLFALVGFAISKVLPDFYIIISRSKFSL